MLGWNMEWREFVALETGRMPCLEVHLTGALISAATNKDKDKIVIDAIAGGAHCNCIIIHQLPHLIMNV
ncbi:hypothetical protein OIU78_019090 [Salix suchowensis]|nr:hypothetical protein OIU78_019090 [Salix suchowensis]